MDDALAMLRTSAGQGVLMVRDMGCPRGRTFEIPDLVSLPRLIACGEQLVAERYFPGLTPVPPGRLVEAGLALVARGATWVKVLTDMNRPGLVYRIEEIEALVRAVHAAGARVAAHALWGTVGEVVDAGVDSIEHGCSVDAETLRRMADRGVAWVPTLGAFEKEVERAEALLAGGAIDASRRARVEEFLATFRPFLRASMMIPVAWELGVTVLASTDRHGSVADEVERFVRHGIEPAQAVASACTTSRAFLGAPGLEPGAPADVITFDRDPTRDPSVLHAPVAILRDGHRIR
jgi:imidazolonepropionase-like amidohydrolase